MAGISAHASSRGHVERGAGGPARRWWRSVGGFVLVMVDLQAQYLVMGLLLVAVLASMHLVPPPTTTMVFRTAPSAQEAQDQSRVVTQRVVRGPAGKPLRLTVTVEGAAQDR